MKKKIAVLMAVILLMNVSAGFAEGIRRRKTLIEVKNAVNALSAFLGDPSLIDMEKTGSSEDINARYIFILSDSAGCDLGVAIRVSDTQIYLWDLELTPANLIKAKLVLDEDAPACYVLYLEGDELKDSAIYYKEDSSILTYESFKSDVERITSSLASGDMSAATGSVDPILACFPGLSWGMTKDEMINTVGKDLLTEIKLGTDTFVTASPEIFGETVSVVFIFNDDKVNMFTANIDKESWDKYLEALTQAYGKPHQTTHMGALNGTMMDIKDDPSGDCYAWKSNKSLIILDSMSIEYWPLY